MTETRISRNNCIYGLLVELSKYRSKMIFKNKEVNKIIKKIDDLAEIIKSRNLYELGTFDRLMGNIEIIIETVENTKNFIKTEYRDITKEHFRDSRRYRILEEYTSNREELLTPMKPNSLSF